LAPRIVMFLREALADLPASADPVDLQLRSLTQMVGQVL
jgi:hypothetical protein